MATKHTVKQHVAYVAGSSAGHILPALALAHQEKSQSSHIAIIFFTTHKELDQTVIENETIIDRHISLNLGNPPSSFIKKILYGLRLFFYTIRCLFILKRYTPTHIVSTGGYISLPVVAAAYILNIPVEFYELNAIPGKAALFLAPWVKKISCTYEHAQSFFPPQTAITLRPYPLLIQTSSKDVMFLQNDIAKKKILLVLGGSQGSSFLNTLIAKNINCLKDHFYIIHQTGILEYEHYKELYKNYTSTNYVFSYQHSMHYLYTIADIVICRAGAGTLAEIVYFKKQAIVIPLETPATDHQLYNAQETHRLNPELITILRQSFIEAQPDIFIKHILQHTG